MQAGYDRLENIATNCLELLPREALAFIACIFAEVSKYPVRIVDTPELCIPYHLAVTLGVATRIDSLTYEMRLYQMEGRVEECY